MWIFCHPLRYYCWKDFYYEQKGKKPKNSYKEISQPLRCLEQNTRYKIPRSEQLTRVIYFLLETKNRKDKEKRCTLRQRWRRFSVCRKALRVFFFSVHKEDSGAALERECRSKACRFHHNDLFLNCTRTACARMKWFLRKFSCFPIVQTIFQSHRWELRVYS